MKKKLLTISMFAIIGLSANAQTCSTLSLGTDNDVFAIARFNGNIYAGGYFSHASGVPAAHIAQFNGTLWSAVGSGVNGEVFALTVFNGALYVGGSFTLAGSTTVSNIAKWDGTTWSGVGTSGINGTVQALIVFNNTLYAGGHFDTADGITVNHVAKLNGTTWATVGGGMTWNSNDIVYTFTVFNNELHAGGNFNGNPGVVKYNGSTWVAVGTGLSGPTLDAINCLAVYNSQLYAGGAFFVGTSSFGSAFVRLNGTVWNDVSNPVEYGPLWGLAVYNGELYLAGSISGAIGSSIVGNIKKWNGTSYSYVPGTSDNIWTLYADNNGLYAGGSYTFSCGALTANNITKWFSSVGIDENDFNENFSISPNPFTFQTTISFTNEQTKTNIILTDILGKELFSTTFSGKQYIIEKGEMKPGVYFIKIAEDSQIITKKLIIQ